MLELGSVDETVVRRMRLAAGGLDPLNAALRARSAFSAVTTAASGVGPRAVLCVRVLRDPRPRSCSFDPVSLRVPQIWRERLGEELSRLARAARRPAREAVPASADSVLFADHAELLAGLGADFCAGRAAERWWWRSLLGQAPDARAVAAAWERCAEYAPAALELLSRDRAAGAFALSLPAGAAEKIFRRVARAHALDELTRALVESPRALVESPRASAPPTGEARASSDDAERRAGRASAETESEGVASLLPPWHGHAPEGSEVGPDVARQTFVGVSLMIVRAPSLARRTEFARRVLLWSRRQSNAGPPRVVAGARVDATRDDIDETQDAADARARDSTSMRARERRATNDDAPRPEQSATLKSDESARSPRPSARHAVAAQGDGADVASPAPADGSVAERLAASRASDEPREAGLHSRDDDEGVRREVFVRDDSSRARGELFDRGSGEALGDGHGDEISSPLLEAEIETRFGGLFYLVNLGQYLGLYGDFTTPASPGIELPLWDFVALVGRRLVGPRVERDAVWPLLARLACRGERAEPGAHFRPSDEWRAPADWLKPFAREPRAAVARDGSALPTRDCEASLARDGGARLARDSGSWLWSLESSGPLRLLRSAGPTGSGARARLRLLHPRGFFVIDVPLEVPAPNETRRQSEAEEQIARAVERQLAREIETYREFVGAADLVRAPRGLSVPWRAARSRWIGHVAAYARARLRLALGAGTRTQIGRRLVERRARVCVTATHVDVLMRLADLPIEVRCAGLDRDPGWVPAAGRHVAFHFD